MCVLHMNDESYRAGRVAAAQTTWPINGPMHARIRVRLIWSFPDE